MGDPHVVVLCGSHLASGSLMYRQLARRGEESPGTRAICASLQSQSGLACSPILSLSAQAKGIRQAIEKY